MALPIDGAVPMFRNRLKERHSGARTSGSAERRRLRSIVARGLALLAFSRARLAARPHCINLVQCVVLRCCGISERGKEVAQASEQALLILLGIVHARRPLLLLFPSLFLSVSFSSPPASISRAVPARANLYTAAVRSHAIEHARESCSSSCASNDPALPMYRGKRSRKKTLENLGHPLRDAVVFVYRLMGKRCKESNAYR